MAAEEQSGKLAYDRQCAAYREKRDHNAARNGSFFGKSRRQSSRNSVDTGEQFIYGRYEENDLDDRVDERYDKNERLVRRPLGQRVEGQPVGTYRVSAPPHHEQIKSEIFRYVDQGEMREDGPRIVEIGIERSHPGEAAEYEKEADEVGQDVYYVIAGIREEYQPRDYESEAHRFSSHFFFLRFFVCFSFLFLR